MDGEARRWNGEEYVDPLASVKLFHPATFSSSRRLSEKAAGNAVKGAETVRAQMCAAQIERGSGKRARRLDLLVLLARHIAACGCGRGTAAFHGTGVA